ncbi:MAG: Rieske (2Fe-2S) protein [Chitinophagales bacterium]|jgi:nitrite reductase/ring-hydroxylating ferredoxin subunit|nr:Rieske (2Fe-2S) protein [Sphingobacteriales bacterium]
MRIFHVSEDPTIEIFHPRPATAFAELKKDVVFAVSETLLHNYLLPRDCPRVTFYAGHTTSEDDKVKFLSDEFEYVLAIEEKWLEKAISTTLYLYEFDAASFEILDKVAGYFISYESQTPIGKTILSQPIQAIKDRGNIDLKILDNLQDLAQNITDSSLNFSIIRMRNAQPTRLDSKKKISVPLKYIPKPQQTSIFIQGGKEYCIVNLNGEIYAIDNICPHQGASLGLGEIKGEEILCPLHQWRFNVKTGECNVEKYCVERYEVEIME